MAVKLLEDAENPESFDHNNSTSQKLILSNALGEEPEMIELVMKTAKEAFNSCTVLHFL